MRPPAVVLLVALAVACTNPTGSATSEVAGNPLTIYSGRNQQLVGPLIGSFERTSGIDVEIRYATTAQQAATIREEGRATPADVFYSQDAGALGALADAGQLKRLPEPLLSRVAPRFRSHDGVWIGVSGRARVVVYNTQRLTRRELPDSVFELTDRRWRGRVGWAPTNASFQAFVTAMRVLQGDAATRRWLDAMLANKVQEYASNIPIVDAVGRGEIDVGLTNHYYLYRFLAENRDFPAANAFLEGDLGALVNVSGVGVIADSDQTDEAVRFVEFLLSPDAQRYFATETFEYPLVAGAPTDRRLPALSSIDAPDIDLSDLDDLAGTLNLLREVGALQ